VCGARYGSFGLLKPHAFPTLCPNFRKLHQGFIDYYRYLIFIIMALNFVIHPLAVSAPQLRI